VRTGGFLFSSLLFKKMHSGMPRRKSNENRGFGRIRENISNYREKDAKNRAKHKILPKNEAFFEKLLIFSRISVTIILSHVTQLNCDKGADVFRLRFAPTICFTISFRSSVTVTTEYWFGVFFFVRRKNHHFYYKGAMQTKNGQKQNHRAEKHHNGV